jgi:UDP-N-acetylmuramoylalanine--D-glutamate ligase
MKPYSGINTVIVGLAREGVALARFLSERGAQIAITDIRPAEALRANLDALKGLAVEPVLGGHPPTLLDQADIVFVSPGVPGEIPFLCEARRRKLPLSSETRLFTRLCRAPVIGITGSSGKTTTTALVGEMLHMAGKRTWVGGNIGQPLTPHLDCIAPEHVVVMELSSFQLEYFGPWPETAKARAYQDAQGDMFDSSGWSPRLAGLLNITPNHLDRHHTMEAYTAAKLHILDHQGPDGIAVLNLDNAITSMVGQALQSERQVVWFSLERQVTAGAFLRGRDLVLRQAGMEDQAICAVEQLKLLGSHNVANTLAACALASAAGAPVEAIRDTTTTFRGVAHRLELVREHRKVRWYNDSIATSPERTVAALQVFAGEEITLLAGGRDKHLVWEDMADQTRRLVRHLILFGEAAAMIEEKVLESGTQTCTIFQAGNIEEAVKTAAELTGSGGVVLLSPGGTSFDAYPDFVARGEHFRALVEALE